MQRSVWQLPTQRGRAVSVSNNYNCIDANHCAMAAFLGPPCPGEDRPPRYFLLTSRRAHRALISNYLKCKHFDFLVATQRGRAVSVSNKCNCIGTNHCAMAAFLGPRSPEKDRPPRYLSLTIKNATILIS